MKAVVVLEDGTLFYGDAFGHIKEETYGEIVFNTSISGYQEIVTDPSYKGQIVAMTYPLIGNYGINDEDVESEKPQVEGFIVKELCQAPSNFRSKMSLDDYFKRHNIMGISGIDTRALTRRIRIHGSMKGVISTRVDKVKDLIKSVEAFPSLVGIDMVKEVTCSGQMDWSKRLSKNSSLSLRGPRAKREGRSNLKKEIASLTSFARNDVLGQPLKVAVLDCGVKYSILRNLEKRGCLVTRFPAKTSAKEILEFDPDGILLSNGPGDPEGAPYVFNTVRELIGKKPIFGICLGHQMLGLALGGKTYKLKFGHHGANHPVKDMRTGKVHITAQNHCFCVDYDSVKGKGALEITHMNLNDNTVEGMESKELKFFSIQFHPEAGPGPHDASYMFDKFVDLVVRATSS